MLRGAGKGKNAEKECEDIHPLNDGSQQCHKPTGGLLMSTKSTQSHSSYQAST